MRQLSIHTFTKSIKIQFNRFNSNWWSQNENDWGAADKKEDRIDSRFFEDVRIRKRERLIFGWTQKCTYICKAPLSYWCDPSGNRANKMKKIQFQFWQWPTNGSTSNRLSYHIIVDFTFYIIVIKWTKIEQLSVSLVLVAHKLLRNWNRWSVVSRFSV